MSRIFLIMFSNSPQDRLARAELSLEGLSVGDAFGQLFFTRMAEYLIQQRALPNGPWFYTDDTVMAISIIECLEGRQGIERDILAQAFASRYAAEPDRGYGGTAHRILREIGSGEHWTTAAGKAFGGMGSAGNGGAMRAGPIGAYFADDMKKVVAQARASAEVTHANPEGQAGAIAVAAAAAQAWNLRDIPATQRGPQFLESVIHHTPPGSTREGLIKASRLPLNYAVETAVFALGNGTQMLAEDTVPFALWCIARNMDNFEETLWTTVSGLGDRDTTCAIAGSVTALAVGRAGIPNDWISAREALKK